MIHVIATIELAPGTRETFLTEFRKIISDVRAEIGCIEYGPADDALTDLSNQAKVGPDKVVVVEKWEDLAALKAHSVSPHMQAYRVNVKDYVRGVHLLVLDPAEKIVRERLKRQSSPAGSARRSTRSWNKTQP